MNKQINKYIPVAFVFSIITAFIFLTGIFDTIVKSHDVKKPYYKSPLLEWEFSITSLRTTIAIENLGVKSCDLKYIGCGMNDKSQCNVDRNVAYYECKLYEVKKEQKTINEYIEKNPKPTVLQQVSINKLKDKYRVLLSKEEYY